jgi:hypothetical protein
MVKIVLFKAMAKAPGMRKIGLLAGQNKIPGAGQVCCP